MAVTLNGSSGLVFNDGTSQATGGYTGFRNRIINGDMRIWQRGTSFTANGAYNADRWYAYTPSGTPTVSLSTDVPSGFIQSAIYSGIGVDAVQRIELANSADLVGGSVTIQFRLKQTVGAGSGSMTVSLKYANAKDNFSATTAISSTTVTATSSWATYQVTFTSMPAGVANGLQLEIYSTSQVSTATFYITGVQLEAGSVATPFEQRPYGTELALCQRYYESGSCDSGYGISSSADLYGSRIQFVAQKRAAPTMVVSGSYNGGASGSINAAAAISASGFTPTKAAGGSSGQAGVIFNSSWTASAEL